MEIINQRLIHTDNSTLGALFVDGKLFSFVLEDEKREVKIPGKTRIAAGTYDLQLRTELTPLTKKYRGRFNFFRYHIELANVPNFKNIYIHVGNTDDDTEGCQLVGYTSHTTKSDFTISQSVDCYTALYKLIYDELIKKNKVTYTIKDESNGI
jgi:hypothetical protein